MTKIQVELPPKVPLRWARDYPVLNLLRFNVNDYVRVKLTQHGLDVHKREHELFWWSRGKKCPYEYEPPKPDADGFYKFQMWEFLEKFGKDSYLTAKNVIEGNDMYFERSAMRSEPNSKGME